MPLTRKFAKIKGAMCRHYGKKKGTQVAYAYAKKNKIKVHKKR